MNDLVIRIKYSASSTDMLARVVHLTFPLWGIVSPALTGWFVLWMIMLFVLHANAQEFPPAFHWGIFTMTVSLLGYRLNKLLEKDTLITDRFGIELPGLFGAVYSAKLSPWGEMQQIKVLNSSRERARIIFVHSGGKSCSIDCSRLSPGELEQLLLAIQLWAPASAKDPTVAQLQAEVKSQSLLEDRSKLDPSYTAIWEDELRRRFRQVAFVPLTAGSTIRDDSLKVVRQLAMGGLSAIYLCQLNERDMVVVKEAATPEDSAPELKKKAEELFEREAQILMKLSHPNVVKVLDYFATNGRNYLMLDYIKGRDLRQYVKQNGVVRESVVLDWAGQMASALEYLHSQAPPVVHRDFTPDNIVVRDDGSIVVIDFGAANEFIGNSTGTFVGKQCYIAPEQFRGKAEPLSDIYAFGCTVHFLLTAADPEALSQSHARQLNDLISPEMDALVARCTSTSANERPSSSDLKREIESIFSSGIAK